MSSGAALQALRELTPSVARAWLVGGAVRDELLGREPERELDLDLAVQGDAGALARALRRAADGHAFQLSDEFGSWRVRGRDGSWQVDLTPLQGETLEHDLRNRDLTINAIARELPGGELVDPCGGVADLQAGRLRAVSPQAFSSDPLRVLRLVRMASELGFEPEAQTLKLAREATAGLHRVAAERVFAELRLTLCSDRAQAGLELAHALGATAVVLPELDALRGVEQSHYHHLDVYEHTLATLQAAIELEREPEGTFGAQTGARLRELLAEPLANEMTRGQALRLGALLHDIAKPLTLAHNEQGMPTFFHHDVRGAELASAILTRLRASERLTVHVAALVRHHLRLGFLVHEQPLSERAVFRYLSTCDAVAVDVSLLSVADRRATLGRNAERAVALHVELARELVPRALAYWADPPKPPIRGDVLARALGLEPGPLLGRLLAELTAAAYAGELGSEQAVLTHAREWLAAQVATAEATEHLPDHER